MNNNHTSTNYPEKIYNGDIEIRNKAELVEFGKNNFTRINGDLKIVEIGDMKIIDLEPLRSISYIKESLTIEAIFRVNNINGLNNLTFIGDMFMLNLLENVESIEGLSNLKFTDSIMIGGLLKIKNLNGLENLKTNRMYILDNSSLIDFSSLANNIAETSTFKCSNNEYNPSKKDIIDGKYKI